METQLEAAGLQFVHLCGGKGHLATEFQDVSSTPMSGSDSVVSLCDGSVQLMDWTVSNFFLTPGDVLCAQHVLQT